MASGCPLYAQPPGAPGPMIQPLIICNSWWLRGAPLKQEPEDIDSR